MADTSHIEEIEAQAALYALGAMETDEATRFEQRLKAGCALCSAEVSACEQVAMALPLSAPEAAPPPGLRARVLASISQEPDTHIDGLGEGILVRPTDTQWQSGPAPGVEIRPLHGKRTMLVRLAPKTWLPEHDHKYAEQCLVLEGSIASGGVTAHAGDFTYYPPGSSHHAIYSEDGCLLLIAYT